LTKNLPTGCEEEGVKRGKKGKKKNRTEDRV